MWTWFYIPALVYLIIVTATGSILRFQWTAPEYTVFNAQYLIHAHSHVAILGWLFLMVCGILLEYGMQRDVLRTNNRTAFSVLVQITVVGMLISFALEGYAFTSILFSSLHIILSYYFAVIYFRYERMDLQPNVRNFYNAAVFWMILSSFGPWLMAAGSSLTPFWIDSAISFYLHLQFNGWFIFFLFGFAYQFLINRHYHHKPKWGSWPFCLIFLGLLPSLLPMLDSSSLSPWIIVVGSVGTLVYTVGSGMVLWLIWKSRVVLATHKSRSLFLFAFSASIVKTIMQGSLISPIVVNLFLESHYVVIAFIHLLLLGLISTSFLFIITLKNEYVVDTKSWLAGSVMYQLGVTGMLLLLFGIGLMQVLGKVLYFNFQMWLFVTGLVVMVGVLWMTGSLSVWQIQDSMSTSSKKEAMIDDPICK
ncbi:MAG: hypothetical protein WD267_10990 [Balneolales bacterium]